MASGHTKRIGQLAKRTGVSIKALRFYDSHGLLLVAGRSESNYRLFGSDAVRCVESIGTLKAAGLTIRDLRELAAAHRAGGHMEALLSRKLTQVLERLNRKEAELQVTKTRLFQLLADVHLLCCQDAAS